MKAKKEVDRIVAVLESLLHRIRKGEQIQTTDVNYVIRASAANEPHVLDNSPAESIPVFSKRGVIRPKTAGQSRYVEGIKKQRPRIWHWTGGDRENLPCYGDGCFCA